MPEAAVARQATPIAAAPVTDETGTAKTPVLARRAPSTRELVAHQDTPPIKAQRAPEVAIAKAGPSVLPVADASEQGSLASNPPSHAKRDVESIATTAVEHSVVVSPIPVPSPATTSPALKRGPESSRPVMVEGTVAMAAAAAVPTPPRALPPANLFPRRFRDEAIYGGATMVQRRIEEASRLASRGAVYASRAKLMDALRLLAEGLDAAEGTTEHRQALKAAFKSLEEANDFSGGSQSGALDVARLAATHRTPLATSLPPNPTAAQALARYYAFAIQEFARAFPGRDDASVALYGLGKLHERLVEESPPPGTDLVGDAVVYQRAALVINNRNWYAANELGVLLTHAGQLHEAADWLHACARLSQRPEAWHNVAVVSEKLGETQWAGEALRRSALAGYRPASQNRPTIQWVTPAALSMGPHSSWARPEPGPGQQGLPVQPVSAQQPQLAPVNSPDDASPARYAPTNTPARSDSVLHFASQKRSVLAFPWLPWSRNTATSAPAADLEP